MTNIRVGLKIKLINIQEVITCINMIRIKIVKIIKENIRYLIEVSWPWDCRSFFGLKETAQCFFLI